MSEGTFTGRRLPANNSKPSKAPRRLPTRLTLSNKRRRRNNTAVLLKATEARPLRGTVRLPANRSTAPHRGSSTALRPRVSNTARLRAMALPRKGNNTARHRQLLRRRTTARPPTRHAPTARRLGPQDRRTEFAETIIPTFAETYRDTSS